MNIVGVYLRVFDKPSSIRPGPATPIVSNSGSSFLIVSKDRKIKEKLCEETAAKPKTQNGTKWSNDRLSSPFFRKTTKYELSIVSSMSFDTTLSF